MTDGYGKETETTLKSGFFVAIAVCVALAVVFGALSAFVSPPVTMEHQEKKAIVALSGTGGVLVWLAWSANWSAETYLFSETRTLLRRPKLVLTALGVLFVGAGASRFILGPCDYLGFQTC